MVTLNKKIKDFRKSQGLTQQQMASRLGISQPAYQKIEAGETDSMRVKTLRNLCTEFNLSADWLLGIGESNIVEFPQPLYIGLDVGNTYSAISVETENGKE